MKLNSFPKSLKHPILQSLFASPDLCFSQSLMALNKSSNMNKFVCLRDFEKRALELLPLATKNYFSDGAGEQFTVQLNRDLYKQLRIRPRCLQDVSKIDMSLSILGMDTTIPIGISPCAKHKSAHPDGESATVRAAQEAGTIFILSSFTNTSIEKVAEAAPDAIKWMQVYIHKDRRYTEDLIMRAERSGFKALVVTVDSPYYGLSYSTMRAGWENIPHEDFPHWDDAQIIDKSLSWDEGIKWLVGMTKLPVIAKGILRDDDALKAVAVGCKGIIVSNHGGRNLDTTPASIEVLPEIVNAVGDKVPVMIDGGIRLGTDVFKALAIGAKMVFIGRPILWGLAVGGQEGVSQVLRLLKEDLERAMMFSGSASMKGINRNLIMHQDFYQLKLKEWLKSNVDAPPVH